MYVYPHIIGGLGNNLFQIAAAIGYARKHGVRYAVDPKWKYRKHFPGLNYDKYYVAAIYKEKNFHYEEIPEAKVNLMLQGYFQSEKYFAHCKEEIKELFTPQGITMQADPRGTAIHVRRGDYVRLKDYHYNLEPEYYEEAKKMMPPPYFVFSDDLQWCRENIEADYYIQNDEVTDLAMMMRFDNIIMANSTFSWWGAYLGRDDKKIIAPKKWFGKLYQDKCTKDLYTDRMTIFDVSLVR